MRANLLRVAPRLNSIKASLNLESPWMFQLRNPSNPAASTHAGVLEFIAEEGVVHLPYWVMFLSFPDVAYHQLSSR